MVFFKFIRKVVDQAHVKIFTAQVGIAVGGFDFKNAVPDIQNGNVKSTSAEVKNQDFLFSFL